MNVKLIHKTGRENLVQNALSRKEDHMDMRLLISLRVDKQLAVLSDFDREVLEAYKVDPTAIELNEMFNFRRIPRYGLSSKF